MNGNAKRHINRLKRRLSGCPVQKTALLGTMGLINMTLNNMASARNLASGISCDPCRQYQKARSRDQRSKGA